MRNTVTTDNSPQSNGKRQLSDSLSSALDWHLESTEPKELLQFPTKQDRMIFIPCLWFLPLYRLCPFASMVGTPCGIQPDHVSPVCKPFKELLLLCFTVKLPVSVFLSVDITQWIHIVNPLLSMKFWKSWGDRPRKITESCFTR